MAKRSITFDDLSPAEITPAIAALMGFRYRMLTIVEFAGYRNTPAGARLAYCVARCDCGRNTLVNIYHVKKGNVGSCGCSRSKFLIQAKTTHGHAPFNRKQSHVYVIWKGMKQRCSNPKNSHFKYYGGRGIKVCERWLGDEGFQNFLIDMGEPAPGMSLERKDNDRDYCPDNCVWLPHCDQSKNRRYNWKILCDGQIMTAREAGARVGIPKPTITSRLNMHPRFKKTDIIPIEALMIPKYAKGLL